ncbi:hypothetical protein A0J61_11978, partial [Choanephora cucurbitarum]
MTHCPVCNEQRNFRQRIYIKYVSIAKKIAQLLSVNKKREKLMYRHQVFENEHLQDDSDLFDLYCGDVYEEMKQDRAFTLLLDQGVLLAVDGFTSHKSHKAIMIMHVILLNYEPTIRFQDKNMFQAAILCSDNKPDIRSFLFPIVKEFKKFGEAPMRMLKNGDELLDFGGHGAFYEFKYCI